ncbi:MAG TPA: DUF1501 domain-containing protein [Blastocatellia bacterium]|nr:DUF1501 domain-containing protein [Blastocatellia bacterium]
MAITRRQFIKRSAVAASVGVVLPNILIGGAGAQTGAGRRIFVVIQLQGGNDGLNTLVPYTDSRYQSLRPNLSWKEAELKDAAGRSTLIDGQFGLHPAMSEIKGMYDASKVAIINGVGYPSPNLSHFLSMDIWHTANTNGGLGDGWLGKYADVALFGKTGVPAAAIGTLPKSLFGDKVVVPSISNFTTYTFQTDARFPGDRNNQVNTFNASARRTFPGDTFISSVATTSVDAVAGAAQVQASVGTYTSTVVYPTPNPLAAALKMAAQLIITTGSNLLYVQLGGFDHHSELIGNNDSATNKLVGQHFTLLTYFSQGVKAFYDDLAEHGLADKTVLMQWSEFGRRPQENASFGTDHGTSSQMFIIGDPVHGGLYGEQPSLADLDQAGNLKFKVDFRSVYATILDRWLGADSKTILGSQYENVGFLG